VTLAYPQTAPSVCTASTVSQTIEMDVPVYARDKEYFPDVRDQSWSLGKGGCFTTVERSEYLVTF